MQSPEKNLVLPKSESWKMFNRISSSYDFLNHLFSMGLDIMWRKKISQFLPPNAPLTILDLATGTADVLITLCQSCARVTSAYGLDLADQMLDIGRRKVNKAGLDGKIKLQNADANQIPFAEKYFNVVTMAYGIRNVENPQKVLSEIYRVLQDNGRTLILEFSLPVNRFIKAVYLFYLKHVIPILGSIISGDKSAYRYLNQTIETFPYGSEFCGLLQAAGFKSVQAHPLCFGIVTIYQADKI